MILCIDALACSFNRSLIHFTFVIDMAIYRRAEEG